MQPNQANGYWSQSAYTPSGDQPMDGGMSASSSVVPAKKKNTRASLACDSCRQLKAKCDEARPCKVCRDRGTECKYRDPPPRAADKTQYDVLDGITISIGKLETLRQHLDRMDKRLAKIENIKNSGPGSAAMTDTSAAVKGPHETESTLFTGEEGTKYSSQKAVTADLNEPTLPEDKAKVEPGPPPPVGERVIPVEQTIHAGLLLNWPSIRELTKHHVEREGVGYLGEYPIGQEQNREPLIGGASPYDHVEDRHGVLVADGSPDFAEAKVWSYVGTFKEHILNMHPIVQHHILDQWVREFLDTLPVSTNKYCKTTTAWAVSSSMEATGSKRQRCPAPDDLENPAAASPPSKSGRPSRTIHNALVLTVLALGKVCQHRDFVPDVVHVGNPMSHGGLPGLEYFALATEILGDFLACYNSIENVYAEIFASLYQGQLGRPVESYLSIHKAGVKLQMVMRPSLGKLRNFDINRELIKDTECNQLSLAFWTCLQLESDLLAELPLPRSGLLLCEDDIPYPNMDLLQGFPQSVLDSCLGQIYLQRHLNRIHRKFYTPMNHKEDCQAENPFEDVDSVSDAISGMKWVPPSFAFRENDSPASDILSARLRAKYWGAQVLTYRPFLQQILHGSYFQNHPISVQDQILVYARKAIKALTESTRALHGLREDERPILTSVFSTAHAQWGNLLVLSAAFKDPNMQEYVDEELLRELFQKTIAFLRQSATATSSLRTDMHILEGLQMDFWGSEASHNSR